MPSLGGRAVLTCFVGVASCFKAPGSYRVRGRAKICVPDLLRPVFFSLLCSFLKHSCLIGLSGIVGGKGGPWDPSFGSVPSFGTIHIITAVPDVFTCFSFSNPHVGFPWIPTSWPVLASLCGRASERDIVIIFQMAPPVQVCQQGSQRTSSVFQLPTWLLRCFWASLLETYSSEMAMTQAQRLVSSIPNL